MADAHFVQVTLPAASGVPEDAVVNTFAVITATGWAGAPAEIGEVSFPIIGIYNTPVSVGPAPLSNYLSTTISRAASACEVKIFNVDAHLDGSPHGSPVAIDHFTMGAAGGGSCLPSEVAICAEIRSAVWTAAAIEAPDGPDAGVALDRPRQRETNRKFFGPWQTLAMNDVATVDRPSDSIRLRIRAALKKCNDDLLLNGHTLGVWSRANASMTPADQVAVDDTWDTQRRRGNKRSVMSTTDL